MFCSLSGLSVWAAPQTLTGQISDSMCGKSHAGMGDMGKNPKECTAGCVKAGGKYVFVSGDKVYEIKASSGESVGYRRASASRLGEEALELPAGGLEGSLLLL